MWSWPTQVWAQQSRSNQAHIRHLVTSLAKKYNTVLKNCGVQSKTAPVYKQIHTQRYTFHHFIRNKHRYQAAVQPSSQISIWGSIFKYWEWKYPHCPTFAHMKITHFGRFWIEEVNPSKASWKRWQNQFTGCPEMIFHFPEGIFMVQTCIKLYFLFLSGFILPVEFQQKVCLMLLSPHFSLIMVLCAVVILIPRCVIIFPRSHLVSLDAEDRSAALLSPFTPDHNTPYLGRNADRTEDKREQEECRVDFISFVRVHKRKCEFMGKSVYLWADDRSTADCSWIPQSSCLQDQVLHFYLTYFTRKSHRD